MRWNKRLSIVIFSSVLLIGVAFQPAAAIDIVVDYRYDTSISTDPARRTVIEQAAADVSAIISTTLDPIDLTTPAYYENTVGSATFRIGLKDLVVALPAVSTPDEFPYSALPADQFVMFVGSADIHGLAFGTNGIGELQSFAPPGDVDQDDLAQAAEISVAEWNADWQRGPDAPQLWGTDWRDTGQRFGIWDIPSTISYVGPSFGGITFDTTESWDDSDKLYSIAIHEMFHALGFTAQATAFAALVGPGNEWLGPHARALNGGSGFDIISDHHLNQDLMSPRITDGTLQTPIMVPFYESSQIALTEMDLAILQDIGYTLVPEPSTLVLLGVGGGVMLLGRRRRAACCVS